MEKKVDRNPQDGRAAVTRRVFLGGAVVLVCGAPVFGALAGCEERRENKGNGGGKPQTIDGWEVPAGTTLSVRRYATLCAAFDALIPGDPSSPGAFETRAAWYLDQLLGAFSVTPPRIFAGGPYSGRRGGLDGFSNFIPLTRVEEIRWRTCIEGSRGIPEREFNGPVKGLVERYEEGLDALEAAAASRHDKRFTLLELRQRRDVLLDADKSFVDLSYVHAVEGTYGDPIYGGNFEMKGWKAIDYEGDRQPGGFTARQMLHPEEG